MLEQQIDSDLPGQVKALVMSNVYDTATGQYLLIPQGSRIIGKYESGVAYGQKGVQVGWSRLLFPDGSSIDLDGMQGLDAHGNAGLRDTIDRHYKRLFGMTALASLLSGGFALSQARNQSVLSYPSPGEMATAAISQDAQSTTSQITRQNLAVPPTVKVAAGYKFTVRVDRDMVFDAPYAENPKSITPAAGHREVLAAQSR